jgi:hypothetical protein
MRNQPFLTAQWTELAMVSYAVRPASLRDFLPPRCELDLIDGDAFVSLVAFNFRDTRVLGIPWPGFRNFAEVNLRFYVRHEGCRGVCFLREFIGKRAIALVARAIYNEPFRVTPVESRIEHNPDCVDAHYEITLAHDTYRLHVTGDAETIIPGDGTPEHFFKDLEWGFGTSRRGHLIRYRVEHPIWAIHPVQEFELDWNWDAIYGASWRFLQDQKPVSVMLVEGSLVRLFPKGVLRSDRAIASRPIVATEA